MYCVHCGTPLENGVCPNCNPTPEPQPKKPKLPSGVLPAAVALPALAVLFVVLVMPALITLMMSFQNYNVRAGLAHSPWVGFENFSALLSSAYFPRILKNTFLIGLFSILLGSGTVFGATYGISQLKNKWVRRAVLSAMILPSLLPIFAIITSVIPQHWLTNAPFYPLAPILYEVVCVAPLAVLAGSFACKKDTPVRTALFVAAGYAGLRLMSFFSLGSDFISASYNPLIYETADVLATYSFRTGMQNGNLSAGAAMSVVRMLLQLIPVAVGSVILLLTLRKEETLCVPTVKRSIAGSIPALLIAVVMLILALFTVFCSLGGQLIITNLTVLRSILIGVLIAAISAFPIAIFGSLLACPMISGSRPVRAGAIIILALLVGCMENAVGQYIFIRSLDGANTIAAVVLSYLKYALYFAFGLFLASGGKGEKSLLRYLRSMAAPALALLGVTFARLYGTCYNEPMLYLNNRALYPISLLLREVLNADGQFGFFSTLVIPVLIALAVIWLSGFAEEKE